MKRSSPVPVVKKFLRYREEKLKSAAVKIKLLSRSLEVKYPSLRRHQ